MKHAATITLLIAIFSSCVPARRGYYFYDLKETKNNIDSAQLEASRRIQPGDRLVINIVVEDHEGNQLLNAGMLGAGGTQQTATASSGFGYLVDNNGKIAIPRLGEIYVKGQTPQEVGEIIKQRTAILYKDPVVYCNLSGRIVIIRGNGVGGVIPITNNRLTILEAMGQAGDIDPSARRDKVWVIREENGQRVYCKVDVSNKNIFDSPYFYLRNNDIVYVEPGKLNSFLNVNAPIRNLITVTASLATLVLFILKR